MSRMQRDVVSLMLAVATGVLAGFVLAFSK
jgi:hypothetical protein